MLQSTLTYLVPEFAHVEVPQECFGRRADKFTRCPFSSVGSFRLHSVTFASWSLPGLDGPVRLEVRSSEAQLLLFPRDLMFRGGFESSLSLVALRRDLELSFSTVWASGRLTGLEVVRAVSWFG